jgi:hypothetical protein
MMLRNIFCLAALLAASFAASPAFAGWNALDTYTFSGVANGAVPAPTSYASPSSGQSWSDVHGSTWSVSSGVLQGVTDTTDGSQFKRDFLIAGSSTDEVNEREVTTLATGFAGDLFEVFRYQRSGTVGNAYVVGFNSIGASGAGTVAVYTLQGTGNATAVLVGSVTVLSTAYNSAHGYSIDANVTGANPTVISVTMTDTTTSAVVANFTVSDSTSNLQQVGAMGLDIANNAGAAAAQTNKVGGIQTFNYVNSAIAVSLPQPNIYFPPQGWDLTTTGHAIVAASGNYFKTSFSLSVSGPLALTLNTAQLSSVTDTSKPYLTWFIDNGQPQSLQLTTANTAGGQVPLSSSLAAGAHTLEVVIRGSAPQVNHWNYAAAGNIVDITGFSLGNGGTMSFSPVATLPNTALFFGDSMTEGEGTDGLVQNSNIPSYAANDNATHSYVPALAGMLNAEFSVAAFGGQGWTTTAADGVTPGLNTSYQYKYAGISQSLAGLNYVFVNMGTNGNTIGATGTVAGFLTNLRAACGSGTVIIVFVPWSGAARSALIADFTAYQGSISTAAAGQATVYKGGNDSNAVLIDLGASSMPGLSLPAGTNVAGSRYSFDTVHLTSYGNERVIALASQAIMAAIQPQTGTYIRRLGTHGGIS